MVKKVVMPKLGETMEEGEIIKWLKKEGDQVEKGEPLLEIATDKANMEVEAIVSGYVRKILAKEEEIIPVTETIAYIADSMEEEFILEGNEKIEVKALTEREKISEKEEEFPAEEKIIKASPLAKKLAREKNLNLAKIKGTGPRGRIIKEDILKAVEKKAVLEIEKIPVEKKEIILSRVEKIMAEKMTQSKKEIPHFYLISEVIFLEAVKLRKDLIEEFEKEKKVHITYTDLIIKACARALRKFPRLNSHYEKGQIISFSKINLNIAIARERGLVVPIIKDPDHKNLFEIARERQNLLQKAYEDNLSLEDMEGGTFTLSNLGVMQVKNFCPIINPPQVCLLATGEIKEKAIVIKGEITAAPIMEMTLSCDHRAIDGYLGARFLKEVKKGLEKPALLLL